MQRPNTRQTGPSHSPTPSFPSSPFSRGGKLIQPNAHENWSVAATVGLFGPKFTLFLLGLCLVLLSCLGPMLGFVGLSLAHLGTMLPPPGCFGPTFTLFLVYVGPSWDVLGLCWPILGLCWVLLRSMLRHLGSLLAYLEAILGLCWDHVGFCWVVLGLCWPILGLCWAFLGSMLGHLGFVLAYLGAMLRRRGTM